MKAVDIARYGLLTESGLPDIICKISYQVATALQPTHHSLWLILLIYKGNLDMINYIDKHRFVSGYGIRDYWNQYQYVLSYSYNPPWT